MGISWRMDVLQKIDVTFKLADLDWAKNRYRDDLSKALKWGEGQKSPCKITDIHDFFHICSANHNHAFVVEPMDWGFDLTEPNCTKAIVHFIEANGDVEERRRRLSLFWGLGAERICH